MFSRKKIWPPETDEHVTHNIIVQESHPSEVCKVCGKRDFRENLIEFTDGEYYEIMCGLNPYPYPSLAAREVVSFVHQGCAKLEQCPCGHGWVKKAEGKKK